MDKYLSFCFDVQSKLYLNFYSRSSSEHLVIKPPPGDSSGNLSRSRGEEVILLGRRFHCFYIYLKSLVRNLNSKNGPLLEIIIIANARIYLKVVELPLG